MAAAENGYNGGGESVMAACMAIICNAKIWHGGAIHRGSQYGGKAVMKAWRRSS